MARKQSNKPEINDTVLADLEMLKETIEALNEVLENFDEYDASDVWDYCDQIEELAIEIKKGVETK